MPELTPALELAPMPEPAPMPDLPGYLHFIFRSRHASHEALGLRMHMRPMSTISTKMKVTKMAYLSRCTVCSAQWSCQPPLPPPQHKGIFGLLRSLSLATCPQFAHAVSTPREPP